MKMAALLFLGIQNLGLGGISALKMFQMKVQKWLFLPLDKVPKCPDVLPVIPDAHQVVEFITRNALDSQQIKPSLFNTWIFLRRHL